MELRSILVPFDFSEASEHAVRYARGLAGRSGAEITVLHVLPPLRYDFAMVEPTDERLREVNEHRVSNALQALLSIVPGVEEGNIHCEVLEGDPAEVIVHAANQRRSDMVVMSTRGAGALRRWFIIGSVTSKVLHGSERPVITSVHFENHAFQVEIGRIICAVDLGPQTRNVLCWGMRAARNFGASLEIAHVVEENPTLLGADLDVLRARGRERALSRIGDIQRDLGVDAEITVRFGHPARALSELAQRKGADLLLLGRGVSHDVLGRLRANAYDIIRQCPCPVASI